MTGTLAGVAASPGLAVGRVARLGAPAVLPATEPPVTDPAAEADLALAALTKVADDFEARAAAVAGTAIGREASDVLAATALMARDPAVAEAVTALTESGRAAAWAVTAAFGEYRELLLGAGGYLAERVSDLDDVCARCVAILLDVPMPGVPRLAHPFVLVAEDLSPADTATLDPERVLAFVTTRGGPTSHSAILAKSLGIPAVVGCAAAGDLAEGALVAVDGSAGTVTVDPDDAVVEQVRERAAARAARAARASGPGRTADGHVVPLLANAGAAPDVLRALDNGAEGVGLLRTEFLFLERRTAPTLAEQEDAYSAVCAALPGKRLVIRTLDSGADKPLPFATLDDEPNPALGIRGWRTAWRYPELLDTQLAAIAAAAAKHTAEVWVMAPMVATAGEAARFAGIARGHGLAKVGVMIEVPSAALHADRIMPEVDFVSIGTNDLSQYTFAADRMQADLAELLDPWQPGLLRLVQLTAAAGVAAGRSVGVCGDAAGDPLLGAVLVGLGVSSLSMAGGCLGDSRATLIGATLAQCQEAATRALAAPTPAAARAAATEALNGG
jgi:phosphotransferase system enzyme I (PtsI)